MANTLQLRPLTVGYFKGKNRMTVLMSMLSLVKDSMAGAKLEEAPDQLYTCFLGNRPTRSSDSLATFFAPGASTALLEHSVHHGTKGSASFQKG